ncbi:hypothetical protein [Streptomyces sp. NPDC002889]|uniref:hypothetical protein n=1 Tax=Streptomyces sp. NPDC002889 TaxID=3364669 RepID=UPI0036B04B11
MRRPSFAATATASVVTVFALTLSGCGGEKSNPPGADGGTAGSTGRAEAGPIEREKKAVAEHDRMFEDVAARCEDFDASSPGPSPSGRTGDGPEPENPKYAENNAFKSTLPMDVGDACRGNAHADRIAMALARSGSSGVRDSGEVSAHLAKLGYPKESVQISEWTGGLRITVSVPRAGPCVTGEIVGGQDPQISSHGFYMEGGCVEPEGGH